MWAMLPERAGLSIAGTGEVIAVATGTRVERERKGRCTGTSVGLRSPGIGRKGRFRYTVAMISKAATVKEYIASLPADRRKAIEKVRAVIIKNLDKGFEEGMGYGMMGWSVPHSIFPAGYHCDPKQPLPFAGLASQKQYMSLYMMGLYMSPNSMTPPPLLSWFTQAWAKSGKKKLDMGKCCIRFKSVDDLPLDVIGEAFRRQPLKQYVEMYEAALAGNKSRPKGKPAAKAKSPPRSATKAATKKGASAKPGKKAASRK